jgi:hypothetical protein
MESTRFLCKSFNNFSLMLCSDAARCRRDALPFSSKSIPENGKKLHTSYRSFGFSEISSQDAQDLLGTGRAQTACGYRREAAVENQDFDV